MYSCLEMNVAMYKKMKICPSTNELYFSLGFNCYFISSYKMESEESDDFSQILETFESVSQIKKVASDIKEFYSSNQVPRRTFRDGLNPLEVLTDKQFQSAYAFTKDQFLHVFDLFKDILAPKSMASSALSPFQRFSTFMFYLRSNGFYR